MFNNNENYEDFEALLNEFMPEESGESKEKKRVKGTIVTKDRNYSYLEVMGLPTTVRVKTEELEGYNEGEEVEVLIVGETEDEKETTYKIGSRRRIDMEDGMKKLEEAHKNNTVLEAKIVKKIKGGYMVSALYHQGFLPNSLSEIPVKDGDKAVGKTIKVIIKDIQLGKDKKGDKITFSRKDVVSLKEDEEFKKLSVGDVVEAEVVGVLEFGLSVKIGILKGFIHISEISWKKIDKLSDEYKVGDKIKAEIISLDSEKKNIKLSIKVLFKNPWDIIAETLAVDSVVDGKVTKVLPYGAFVELIDGVEGLVHISDLTWNKKRVNLDEYVKLGDKIKVKVLEFVPAERKLKLGIKQLVENPWENAEEKFGVDKVLEGKVVEVKDFGVFAEILPGVDVFIHQSDFSWPGEENKKISTGDIVKFKVIELNIDENKIKGSIKATEKSPWEKTLETYKVGQTVEKPIKTIMDFGLFVTLNKGVDGFIPTQLASKDFIKNLKDKFKVGDIVKAQIVEIDKDKQRIKLSIKKIEQEEEKRETQELINKYGVSSTEE